MKFSKTLTTLALTLSFVVGVLVGFIMFPDPNAGMEYSDGYPSNCRALIYELEADYYLWGEYTLEEILQSLFRNCGETGHLWK